MEEVLRRSLQSCLFFPDALSSLGWALLGWLASGSMDLPLILKLLFHLTSSTRCPVIASSAACNVSKGFSELVDIRVVACPCIPAQIPCRPTGQNRNENQRSVQRPLQPQPGLRHLKLICSLINQEYPLLRKELPFKV